MAKKKEENAAVETEETKAKFREKLKSLLELGKKKRLEEAGAATVMPLGAPIGTNKGLQTRDFLRIIIEQANVPVVVDAGIGAPSHAAEAMEMGASACLVNTAIAVAGNPVTMAEAFKQAVETGRMAYEAGLGLQADNFVAEASSPLTAFLDE